ncbi:MAG TPA: sensor histidine kinase [Vitreimonas sp.]|nr:sensor histidine kinase [Vitreimonas sp.]
MRSLRGRLAVLLGLAFLPAGAVAVQAGMTAEAERRVALQQSIGAEEIAAMTDVRDQIISLREVSRSLAANADLFADNRVRCQATVERVDAQYENVTLSVLDAQGRIVCADERRLIGQQLNAASQLALSAARLQPVIGFDAAKSSFLAVAPAELRAQGVDLYVGVAQPAAPLLAGHPTREPWSANLVVDSGGRILFSQGLDPATREADDIRELLEETPPGLLSNAQRVGEAWFVATELEPGSLYIVHAWRPPPPTLVDSLRSGWTLLAPILLWLAAVGAAWYAIELFVARPLFLVERLARAYARGEESEVDEELLRTAPLEMRNLRRTLAAMAKTLRGREARITEALQEERVLLREVHHRVKNNLQMVASILSIQARSADDEAEARGLARAKDRVQMLALAHARIYASGEVRDIALDQLAGDVARQLIAGRGAAASHLRLEMTLDPVRADVDRAVAFAFMIGEAVSNAIDHALGMRGASLNLSLVLQEDGSLVFEIGSDPVPVDGNVAPAAQRLIDAFASQLNARVVREPGNPVFTRIIVPPDAEAPIPHAAPAPPATTGVG